MKDHNIKNEIRDAILFKFPKIIAHKYLYNHDHENKIDFNNPKTYDEKIHWLMVYKYDNTYAMYADKIAVRDYVKVKGLKNILIPLEGKGTYESADTIDFSELPSKFILKTNHGSGEEYYYICDGKKPIDEAVIRRKLNSALRINFAKHFCQYHYEGIKPAIICEKYLSTQNHERLTDYKVVCSFGEPIAILVCKDRNQGRDYYSTDWKYLEYVKPDFRSKNIEERPAVLKEMLEAASILSEPLPLARVDFYVINQKLYFGEITLTPSQGSNMILNDFGQMDIGNSIRLDK